MRLVLPALLLLLSAVPAQSLELLKGHEWRCIGPFRGGRSAAVCGVPSQRDVYYFGATGGGVWKTTNAGVTWDCVSDTFFGGSIGAVAVAESDPNVVYVGGGEVTVRGNVAHGSGMWKSIDAGKTWTQAGLADAHHIPRVRIHPKDPELVYAAVLGHLYETHETRGVYRSKDGGKTWARVLFANADAGACDLCLDPSNARVLYASTWRVRRTPWSLSSGGEGSALWKSTDAGDTWTEISKNEGMPKGTLGIIGVAVSPAKPERVFAIVEAEQGGVLRSDDAGKTWTKLSAERALRQRAWYYSRIYADPKSADTCYVVNVAFHRSTDGGRTFTTVGTPHGDNHDLWIAPEDPSRMIEANDGGACVSVDGGKTWSGIDNQPTAQFYRVTTDGEFPYRVYGAQQDNSTVRIRSRSRGGSIGERDWETSAGGESGWLAPDPKNSEIVYGGSYGGYLERKNHATGESRNVNIWPDNPLGAGTDVQRYRFQWNFPLFFSAHDKQALYAGGNVLFVSRNEGQTWEPISPDVTRNDKEKQAASGGPITKDNTGVEYYCTIFAACESPRAKGLLWCGSDDGLVHVSRDGGGQWSNVTPKGLPAFARVNALEPSPFDDGGLYLAATCYQSGDFTPQLWKTSDYGVSWTKITDGIAADHFTRVVRADPAAKGVLYAGTEQGVYVSFDDGARWQSLQLNLPITPITDLAVKEGDLIAATQGRAFWILDELSLVQQVARLGTSARHLFAPRACQRLEAGSGKSSTAGQNPKSGAVFSFYCKEVPTTEVTLEILDMNGNALRKFVRKPEGADEKDKDKKDEKKDDDAEAPDERDDLGKIAAGLNRFAWNLREKGAKRVPGMVLWGGGLQGPRCVPGDYLAKLTMGGETFTQRFTVLPDPRAKATQEDYVSQHAFLVEARDKLTQAHEAILRIRDLKAQVADTTKRLKDLREPKDTQPIKDAGKVLDEKLSAIEEALYQTKAKSSQDVLNFPIRLNNKLTSLASGVAAGDFRPTDAAVAVKLVLVQAIDAELAKLSAVVNEELVAFNRVVREAELPRVIVK